MAKEKNITRAIMKRLRSEGAWIMKVHGSAYQTAGIPDIIGCYNGRMFAIEVKAPGKRPTLLQQETMMDLVRHGAAVGVATSVDEAMNIFDIVYRT